MAPIVLGIFFFSSIQLFFMGLLGEYIGAIHTLVQKRPHVFERERINFEYGADLPLERGTLGQDVNETNLSEQRIPAKEAKAF